MARKVQLIAVIIAFFSFSRILLAAPSITSLSPNSGPIGTWVTIAGSNFGSTQGTSTVTFNGTTATTCQSWSATSIVVAAPPGTTTGNVVVTVSGVPSAGTLFTEFTTPPIPQVVQVQPANAGTGIPLNRRVVVRFAQPLPAVSVVNGILSLANGSTPVAGTVAQSNDGLSLTFIPSSNLMANTSYMASVQDVGAGATGPQFQSSFTTGSSADATAPQYIQISPPRSATGVPINSPLVMQFTKPMDPSTLKPQQLNVTDNTSGNVVAGMIQVDPAGLTASFVPQTNLGIGRTFQSAGSPQFRDTSGNLLSSSTYFMFTTGFTTDTQGPNLLGISPSNNGTAVPLNAQVVLEFDRPLNVVSVSTGFQIQTGGQAVPGGIALSDGNKRIVFTPTGGLTANTAYSVVTTSQITDIAGYGLTSPGTYSFTAGTTTDATTPAISTVSPATAAGGVPANAIVQLQFSKAINPVTATTSTFQVFPSGTTFPVAGTISVSSSGLIATFTPSVPLAASTNYTVTANNGITDIEGHGLTSYSSNFTTGLATSMTPPSVVSISPENGLSGVPVNARVDVVASAPLSPASVNAGAISLSAGGQSVAGSVSLSSDRMSMTFTPANLLATSTVYTATISGVTDQAGSPITTFTTSFTTSSSGTANTTKPSIVSVSPANGASGVAVTSTIALTFNEPVDFKTINTSTVTIRDSSLGVVLAGSYSLDSTGKVVTFTPLSQFRGNSTISVVATANGISDLCGNLNSTYSSSFSTAATADTAPPSIVSVTPANGATNIGLNAQVVLTFSKSINPATVGVGSPNLALYANSSKLGTAIANSADNRTVTLNPSSLPANSTVEIMATSGVTDLSGNPLPNFSSLFSTGAGPDSTYAMVVAQRPGNAAYNVPLNSNIVLYINEPMNVSTLSGALHISQNGIAVSGTTQVTDAGQVVQFTPSAQWQPNSLIQVFLDSTALDTDGNPMNSYQASFTTVADNSTKAPALTSWSPGNAASVPTNAVVTIGFDQPLNPATVNANTAACYQNNFWQQGAVNLLFGGTVVQIVPRYPLAPNTATMCSVTGSVQGMNGVSVGGLNLNFTTGSGPDSIPPTLISVSPPNGYSNVGDNANIRLVFSKPINPLSVNSINVQLSGGGVTVVPDSISFSNNNQSALIVPHTPLPDGTQMTLTVNGITDVAGNPLAPQTVQFTTGNGPDLVSPVVVSVSPYNSAVNVPLNSIVALQANEAIDPGSVNSTDFTVTDATAGQQVAGTYSVSSDGLNITFLPAAPLTANHVHSITIGSGITDLSGNFLVGSGGAFTAGTTTSTSAPQVTGLSPANGATAIPTNAQILVQFNEPVDAAKSTGITLSSGGGTVKVSKVFSSGNQTVALIPALPLAPSTAHTLTVAGVQDLSGNAMGSPVTASFTTSSGPNWVNPTISSVSPSNNSTGISLNATVTVNFAYPIDPLTVTTATFEVYPVQTQIPIAGTVSAAANGMSATFTPSQPLDPSTMFVVKLTGGDLDLEGRSVTNGTTFTTTSGSVALAPVIGSLYIPSSTPGAAQYIYGNYFGTSQGTSTVSFNGTTASVTSWSDTMIAVTIPSAGTSGPITVTVNGTTSNGVVFKYLLTPTISTVSPTTGAAGTLVTITGTNFGDSYDATQVSFGSIRVTPVSWNSTSLTVSVPPNAPTGNISLSVVDNGYASSATTFNVVPTPNVFSINPTSGVAGTPVNINGTNFGTAQGSSTVLFNGVPAASIGSWNSSSITAYPPSNVTTGPVTVTVNGITSNSNQMFTVTNPAIGSLSPPAAAVSGYITISGSGLYTQGLQTQVLFNGTAGIIISYNGQTTPLQGTIVTSLYVEVPVGATSGPLTVMVGGVSSNSLLFTVEQPPTITGISPTSGQIGSWPITISGSGFGPSQNGNSVNFYGNVPAQIVSWSDTEVQVVVPDGTSTGPLTIQVAGKTTESPWFYINAITQLTDSLGNQSQYTSAITGGSWGMANSQGPGCVTCTVRGNTQETVDANGNLLTHTDDLGHTTTYTYDSNNNTTSISQQLDPNTPVATSYAYNSFGEVLSATDPLGNVTTNAYDANGNLISVTTPAPDGHTPASVTKFSYDTKGELTQILDPLNNPTTLSYTPTGLIASITDAQNHTTSYQYDARGNRTAVVDPINGAAHPTTFTYDIMNRLTGMTYPDGSSVSFGYDNRGRRTSVTDQNQKTTTYAYDDGDRLISVTDPANNITQYNYDTEDNLTSITDANGHTTNFAYNGRGWVTQTTFPSTLYETYGYDAVGNLTSKTDRKSQTIQYVYDALNRLIQKNYPDSTSANYVYDLVGKIRQVTDPTGAYGFAYDNMGRLIGTTTQYSFVTGTYSNSYTHDAASNRASLTAPDGSITTYGYDTLNRLNGLANSWAGSFGFGYDALSRRTSLMRPNGVNTSYNYDSASHLLSVLHQAGNTVLDGTSYTYDNAGNRLSKTNYLNGITENYSYDLLYELTQVTQGGSTSESYSYDAVGNRLSSLGVPQYNYNPSNELTSSSQGSYTYDANGNTLTDAQGRSYTWDFENRLVQAVVPGQNGGTTTFKYDPFGRRIQKSGALGSMNYLYDISSVVETVDSNGAIVTRYTQGRNIDEPLAELSSGTASYYQPDGLGSITSISGSEGGVSNTYIYDSFGNVVNVTGTLGNPFQFTSREVDQETGLNYNRARYYNPKSGRFLSEDPIRFKAGVNFYPYVKNYPTVYVDPYGESLCPSWLWPCPDYFHNQLLLNNQQNDQEILNTTATFALDPFCYGKPGATQFVEVWQLERLNVIIDAIELGGATLSALDELPNVEIPNSLSYDQEMEWLASLRERNNQQIDELLQDALEAQEQARERKCPRCRW